MSFSTRWYDFFHNMATLCANMSKDPNTKVGAIIVAPNLNIIATGFNGLPRGVRDLPERMQRPAKYLWTVHAEANAIAAAARTNTSLEGATLYCTHSPCAQCAALIVQVGIVCVAVNETSEANMLTEEQRATAATILSESGVRLLYRDQIIQNSNA